MQGLTLSGAPYRAEIRALFQAAMAIFVVTVAIGILNGLDVIEFDRQTILTHVHAGTLGWITLSVVAVCLWLFGEGEEPGTGRARAMRWLVWLAIVATPLYVAAFFSGNIAARAVFAVPVLAAIVGLLWWLAQQAMQVRLTIPQLAVLAAIVNLTIGGIFGVVVQIELATGSTFVPAAEAIGAHVAAMAFSYLVLIGMAIAEWRLMPASVPRPRAGEVQVGLLFVGGLVLSFAALFNALEFSALSILFELVAVAIFAWRLASRVSVPWLEGSNLRQFGVSAVFVVVDILLLLYLLVAYVIAPLASGKTGPPSFEEIPAWLTFALDHAIFIGVMTNAIFGLVYEASRARASFWPWADHLVFWGLNVGLVGFVVGLALNTAVIKEAFSPIMGASILLGLLTYTLRLRIWASLEEATAAAP